MTSTEGQVLVVGGGPAGIAAACRFAESGYTVQVCDQAPSLGGAVLRGVGTGARSLPVPEGLKTSWRVLTDRLERNAARLNIRRATSFIGMDSNGVAVLRSNSTGSACRLAPIAAVIATGATEAVRPVPGWHHPRVVTVGGLQVNLKMSGKTPDGDIVIAGNGPLLLAAAAQLAFLGNPPVAVIEAGRPMRPRLQHFGLPLEYVREALMYLRILRQHDVPWIQTAFVERIAERGARLLVSCRKGGRELHYDADIVALHDGLHANLTGLPDANLDPQKGVLVAYAGDCREILGVRAASADGDYAARQILEKLQNSDVVPSPPAELRRHGRAQAGLRAIFEPIARIPLTELPDETVLCRCEQKTVGDLKGLAEYPNLTAKEIKLNGRFAMGRCQGRYCASWAMELLAESGGPPQSSKSLTGQRWPVRPISIGALANMSFAADGGAPPESEISQTKVEK